MADLDNEQVLAPEPVVQPQENAADVLNDPVLNPEPQVSQQTDDPLLQQQQIEQEQQVLAEDEAADKAEMARRIDERLSFSADPNRADGGITDEQRVEAAEAIRAEDAAAQEAEIDQIDAESAQLAERVAKRRELIARAEAAGAPISEDPVLDSIIAEQDKKKAATDEDLQSALEPTVEEVEAAAAPIRQQKAVANAEMAEAKKEVEKEAKVEEEVNNQVTQLAEQEPSTFWSRQSTLSKILLGVSIAAGTIDQLQNDTDSNPGIDLLNKAIADDLAMQNLSIEEFKAKQAAGLEKAKFLLETKKAASKDEIERGKLQNTINRLECDKSKCIEELKESKRTRESGLNIGDISKNGISVEDWNAIRFGNDELMSPERVRIIAPTVVSMGDGMMKFAANKELADKAKQAIKADEVVSENMDNIERIIDRAGFRELTNIWGDVGDVQRAQANMVLELKNIFELGVLTGPDEDLILETMGLKKGETFLSAFKTNEAKRRAIRGLRDYMSFQKDLALKKAGIEMPNSAIEEGMKRVITAYELQNPGKTLTNLEAMKKLSRIQTDMYLKTSKSQGGLGLSTTDVNKSRKGK